MALSTAKAVTVLFDQVMDTFQKEIQMAKLVDVYKPEGALLQNSSNVIWRQVEQNAPVKTGWDMTGQFGNILEQSYPATVNQPYNDAFTLRADDFRDEQFLKRRAQAAGRRLSADQNQRIAALVGSTGSLFYRKPAASTTGYNFIAEADSILTERQANTMAGRSFFLNPRAYNSIGADLAQRGTLSGLPEQAFVTGQVGRDISGFDVYKSPYLPNLTGAATPTTTVATTVSYGPATNQTVGGQVLPVDYRSGDITLASASGFVVGDRVGFTGINSVGLLDKTVTNQQMTFSIVAINGNTITVYPRPIALQDASLTAEQKAYANIDAQITAGTAITRLNTDTNVVTNCFWANDSVEILAAEAPFDVISRMSSSYQVVTETLDSGTTVYMMYQGGIATANLDVRVFTWYGLTNRDPSRNGVAVLY